MGGKNDGAKEAKRARQDEEARQARIRQGTQRVNKIFDGGSTGTGRLADTDAYDPTKTYYLEDGSVWAPTSGGGIIGGGKAGSNPIGGAVDAVGGILSGPLSALDSIGGGNKSGGLGSIFDRNSAQSQFEAARKKGLFSGRNTTGGFNDAFFKARRDAYTDYASPQLESQYVDANKELMFALDRAGTLDSSARGEKLSELQKMYDLNKQQVADKALSYETQARTSVEDARANLIATLNATGDAEGAAKAALARADTLSRPAEYSPLGQMFQDFTSGLGIQAAQERSHAAGGPKPAYNTGLFGNTGRVSVRS